MLSLNTPALVASLPVGAAVAPEHTLVAVDGSAGLRIWLEGPHGGLRVTVSPALAVPPGSAATEAAAAAGAARTALFTLSYRGSLPPRQGEAVCRTIASHIARHEHAWLEGVEARHRGEPERRVRAVDGGAALSPMITDDGPVLALDPYVGCLIGCSFCYAQGHLQPWRALAGLPEARWGSWADVRRDLPERLAAAVQPGVPIKFSPIVSDPYHAIERRERITRRCLEALVALPAPPPTVICTRSALVREDLGLLRSLAARAPVWLGMSVPTLDDSVRQVLEPAASPVDERVAVLAEARAQGLATFAIIQPMLPGPPMAERIAEVTDSATLDTLHGTYGAAFDGPLAEAREPAWQQRRLQALVAALRANGVEVWRGELPPPLQRKTQGP